MAMVSHISQNLVQQDVGAKALIARIDVEFIATENPAKRGVVAEVNGLGLGSTLTFENETVARRQLLKRYDIKAIAHWALAGSRATAGAKDLSR